VVRVRLEPAPEDHGLRFERDGVVVPARVENVVATHLATVLAHGPTRISTVEHLLSAALGEGIDNLCIVVDGPELFALDGGAAQWVHLLDAARPQAQRQSRRPLRLRAPVRVQDGPRWILALPAPGLELDVTTRFPHPAVGTQRLRLRMGPGVFRSQLAWARTFGFLDELHQLHKAGKARGAGMDDVLVYGPDGPLDPSALRSPDEPLRHKMLDLLGDLALLGRPLEARLIADMPGHGLTRQLVAALLRRT
jgi:UDP-3-O-[3-hydroxymyristoyl] N-acetylglucosamine deacetylase